MMDNLKQLAALMQVFQGLQGQNSLGDISQLAQLDMANRESINREQYSTQNRDLEQRKFEALLKQQGIQNTMGRRELGLRRAGETRMSAGQDAEIGYRNENMRLQREKADMMKPYYEQLMRSSNVTAQQKEQEMQLLQSLLGGGDPSQTSQPQIGPGEMQFLKTLAEQFKAQPQPTR